MEDTYRPDYISIFVSSTFRDMQAERDILRDKVVPILNEFTAQYGISVELIDLRWGINTKSHNEKEAGYKVLRTCFDEIKRCQPYFIALLGDRYGWIPPYEQVCRAANGAGYTNAESGKSVTEMEIQYGAFILEDSPSCLFYFRELDKSSVPHSTRKDYFDTPENTTRLTMLKEALAAKFPDKIRGYKTRWDSRSRQVGGLDAFAQGVINDIKAELTLRWGAVPSEHKSWQQREEAAWQRFYFSGKEFSGREVECKYISDKLLQEDANILIKGASGSGKSTLLCKIANRLTTEDILLLPHSVGLTDTSFDTVHMLKMFIWRMEGFLQLGQEPDDIRDYTKLKTIFQSLLAQCCEKIKVVFAVDGADRLEEKAENLDWLPLHSNGNVSILLTADDTYSASDFEVLGGSTISISPLYEQDIRCIIHQLARRYHKELDESVVLAMLRKKDGNGLPSARNPLFINLSVQNLVMLDRYEFDEIEKQKAGKTDVAEVINKYLANSILSGSADVRGKYLELFNRAQNLIGRDFVCTLLKLLALCDDGQRESDLCGIFALMKKPWDSSNFAWFRQLFGAQFRQGSDGQWSFTHTGMREAAEMLWDGDVRKYAKAAATHFLSLPENDEVRNRLIMQILYLADDPAMAAQIIAKTADSKTAMMLGRGLSRLISSGIGMLFFESILKAAQELPKAWLVADFYRFHVQPMMYFIHVDHVREKVISFLEAVAVRSQSIDAWRLLGILYMQTPNRERLGRAAEILTKLANMQSSVQTQRDLGLCYGYMADFEQRSGNPDIALSLYVKAYRIKLEVFKQSNLFADLLNLASCARTTGVMMLQKNQLDLARQMLNDAVEMCESAMEMEKGEDVYAEMTEALMALAKIEQSQNDKAGIYTYLHKASENAEVRCELCRSSQAFTQLADIYRELVLYLENEQPLQADIYLQKMLRMSNAAKTATCSANSLRHYISDCAFAADYCERHDNTIEAAEHYSKGVDALKRLIAFTKDEKDIGLLLTFGEKLKKINI